MGNGLFEATMRRAEVALAARRGRGLAGGTAASYNSPGTRARYHGGARRSRFTPTRSYSPRHWGRDAGLARCCCAARWGMQRVQERVRDTERADT